jgi:pimeloyl-ACP methyl ester carboxylesterase
VAYEPPTPWEPWWPRSTPGNQAWRAGRHDTQGGDAAEAFVRSMIGVDAWDVLPEAQRRARRADGPALLADLAALAVPRPFDSTSIGTPVVLAHGTESGDWHIRATSDLAALLPTATLRTVEGAGHLAPTTHPDLVAGLLRA